MLTAALEFLRERGVHAMMVKGYEWDHWISIGGRSPAVAGDGSATQGVSWQVGKPKPGINEAPITDLADGEVRELAQLFPEPDSNIVLLRRDGTGYTALIDSRYSDDDPRRVQHDWKRADTLDELYWMIGTSLQVPTHSYHAELQPYFPLPKPDAMKERGLRSS